MLPKPKPSLTPNTYAYESEPMVKPTGFREYDARWLFGKEINLMGVQALGLGLGTLIHELGVKPEENPTSKSLTEGGKENLASLKKLKGVAFDKAYVDHEVAYHQQVIDAVNNALTLNISVPDGVEATAENGNLTLTGTVSYGAERTAAEDTVAGLVGVRNLSDDIDISNDADPVDVTVYVQDALDRYALILDDSDVTVDTDGNTVTLSGHVRTWAEHDAVVDAAWMAVGVYDVRDNLYIPG